MIDTNLGALIQVHYIIGHGRFHKLNIKQLSKAPLPLLLSLPLKFFVSVIFLTK